MMIEELQPGIMSQDPYFRNATGTVMMMIMMMTMMMIMMVVVVVLVMVVSMGQHLVCSGVTAGSGPRVTPDSS